MEAEREQGSWKQDFALGIALIDEEHKKFIHIIDMLSYLCGLEGQREVKNSQLISVLLEVRIYAQKHFGDEEELLEKCKYPGLKEQYAAHDAFTRLILKTLNDDIGVYGLDADGAVSKKTFKAAKKLCGYLFSWWSSHILEVDAGYVEYVKRHYLTS